MANGSKYLWLVVGLTAVGSGIFFFATAHRETEQGVVLQEVFKQTPPPQAASAGQPAALPMTAKPQADKISTDPVIAPAIVTSPVNGHEAGFLIQVYSFQDKARADKALAGLKQAGYKAFLEVSNLGEKGIWYRVRIGGFANEAQARAMLDDIRTSYKTGFIVKPSKK